MSKKSEYRSSTEKAVSLYSRLLFSREKRSLSELADMLGCSKQTVLRYIQEIQMAYSVEIEESIENRQRYYQIKKPFAPPQLYLTEDEITVLFMCREFTSSLLGKELFELSTRAIEKSLAYTKGGTKHPARNFATLKLGRIDYTPHSETIHRLTEAMKSCNVCKITYKSIRASEPKIVSVCPLVMFSYNDALYLNGILANKPLQQANRPEFDPILAVHRIQKVEVTEIVFERPESYDFENQFNKRFGIMQDETFAVKVQFDKPVADYAGERIWSPDQEITHLPDGGLVLVFKAASSREVVAKVLSFGEHAHILEPEWLVGKMGEIVSRLSEKYPRP